ncbi:hypothetical protein FO519_001370 [Halicephalobus sp. NKZ332]|nr:hypothetical protein FO519_001370 [Halicephalobus sp. NKZ332]
MGINFITHESELNSAFNRVSDSTTGEEWTIFEYDGNSSILKLGDSGEGGLEQLVESLDPAKVQYGFGTVSCPGLKQRKVVLIHWQGASVPVTRLANTASNISAVKEFVKKVNLTVYARSEEDVDIDSITAEINKLAANNNNLNSGYNMFEIPAPVGSTYTPVKPHTDIDLMEREKFWKEQQEEEQERRREEIRKNEEKAKVFQLERKQLETKLHETHLNHLASKQPPPPPIQPAPLQQKKGALVTGRTQMFEQKVQELVETRPLTKPKNFKYEVAVSKPLGAPVNKDVNGNTTKANEGIEQPTYKASELAKQFNGGPVVPPVVVKTPLVNCPPPSREVINVDLQKHSPVSPPPAPELHSPNPGLCVTTLWDYQANESNEISFNPDETITEVEKLHDGWWKGKAPNGQVGLFPSNFVKEL